MALFQNVSVCFFVEVNLRKDSEKEIDTVLEVESTTNKKQNESDNEEEKEECPSPQTEQRKNKLDTSE